MHFSCYQGCLKAELKDKVLQQVLNADDYMQQQNTINSLQKVTIMPVPKGSTNKLKHYLHESWILISPNVLI